MDLSSLFNASIITHPDLIFTSILSGIIAFVPKLIAALLVFIIGKMIAHQAAQGTQKIVAAMNLKKVIDSFKLGISFTANMESAVANGASLIVRYVILYLTFIFTFDILGFTVLATFLRSIAEIIPRLLSAGFVILIGLIIAGVVESLVKKMFVTVDPAAGRLSGKIASYIVISFFVLISLSEIGVASTFINTLLTGFIAALALAFGLAVGLGSKDVVKQIIETWYTSRQQEKQKVSSKKQSKSHKA
jgi:hypothetical protein